MQESQPSRCLVCYRKSVDRRYERGDRSVDVHLEHQERGWRVGLKLRSVHVYNLQDVQQCAHEVRPKQGRAIHLLQQVHFLAFSLLVASRAGESQAEYRISAGDFWGARSKPTPPGI